jgi:hypothetical protein
MSTLIRSLIPFAFVAFAILQGPAVAAEDDVIHINDYLCKDIMRMSDEDRAVSLAVLHGYRLGKKGATSFVSGELSKVSDEFVEYCLDNPQEQALASFEKLAK